MKEKDPSKISWKQMFLFTRNGNLQNTDLLYAFFLGVALLFLNFIIGNRLTMLFESLFPSSSRVFKNILDIGVPALLSIVITWLLFQIIRKKKIVFAAGCVALVIAIIFLTVIFFMYDRETNSVLIAPFACIFLIPSAVSAAAAALLYWHWCTLHPDPRKEEIS